MKSMSGLMSRKYFGKQIVNLVLGECVQLDGWKVGIMCPGDPQYFVGLIRLFPDAFDQIPVETGRHR